MSQCECCMWVGVAEVGVHVCVRRVGWRKGLGAICDEFVRVLCVCEYVCVVRVCVLVADGGAVCDDSV